MSHPRILLLAPVGSTMHLQAETFSARRAVAEKTLVEVRATPGLPPTVYVPPVEQIVPALVAAVQAAEAEGFDAIGISCCSDPGLAEVREAVSVPVSAPFEAFSSLLPAVGPACIFSLQVDPGPAESTLEGHQWIPEIAAAYAVRDHLVGIEVIPVLRPDRGLSDSVTPQVIGEALLRAHKVALDTHAPAAVVRARCRGARVIFPACTYWTGLTAAVEVPDDMVVLDPVEVLARHLETLAWATIRNRQDNEKRKES